MLLVAKRRRMALRVAVPPLVGSIALGAATADGIASSWFGGALLSGVLAGGMFVYVMATATIVRGRAHTLIVSSLKDKKTFDARAAAFGVSATDDAGPGATYTVYVTDGMRSSNVVTYGSPRALGAATRLTEAFAVSNKGGSAEARGLVAREIKAWQAQAEAATRESSAYRASPAWRRVRLVIGLALCVAVMGAVLYLGK